MNWKEFVTTAIKKKIAKKEEIKEQYDKNKKDILARGAPSDQASKMAKRKTMNFYKKMMRSSLTNYRIMIYGVDRISDYGVTKKYEEAVEIWKKDPEIAVAEGKITAKGQPLYHWVKNTDRRKGKPINLKTVFSRKVWALATKESEEGGFPKNWLDDAKESQIILDYTFCTPDTKIPMFQEIEVKLNMNENASNKNMFVLKSRPGESEMKVISSKIIEFMPLAKKKLKHRYVKVPKVKKWIEDHQGKYDVYYITGGDNETDLAGVRIYENGSSVSVNHTDFGMFDDDADMLIGNYPNGLPMNFNEFAIDPVIIGSGYVNKDGDPRANFWGIWVPEYERVNVEIDDINADIEPEIVSNEDNNNESVEETNEVMSPDDEEDTEEEEKKEEDLNPKKEESSDDSDSDDDDDDWE